MLRSIAGEKVEVWEEQFGREEEGTGIKNKPEPFQFVQRKNRRAFALAYSV